MTAVFTFILMAYTSPKVPMGLLPDRNSTSLFSYEYPTGSG
jgi:hypothetical protein